MYDGPPSNQFKPFDSRRKEQYFERLRKGYTPASAARAIGVTTQTLRNHRKSDPNFHASEQEALDYAVSEAERELYERAVTGYDEPLVYQGLLTDDTITRKSDDLLKFFLKSRKPEVYNPAVKVDQTLVVKKDPSELTDEQLAAIIADENENWSPGTGQE